VYICIGQLHQIANDFYGIELTADELKSDEKLIKEEGFQFRFRLNFNNRDYLASRLGSSIDLERLPSSSSSSKLVAAHQADDQLSPLSSNILLQLFPFTVIFRPPDLRIIDTGRQLKQMYPAGELIGQMLPEVARMRRPKLRLTWDNVLLDTTPLLPGAIISA